MIWRKMALLSYHKIADVIDKMVYPYFLERYRSAKEALQSMTPTILLRSSPTNFSSLALGIGVGVEVVIAAIPGVNYFHRTPLLHWETLTTQLS